MRISHLVAAAGALAALSMHSACDNDPSKGKAVAKVAEPVLSHAPLGSATAATKYVFSNAGSTIEFVGAKVTRKHDGAFHVFSGAIELVDGEPAKSVITAEIATASITADDPKLTAHLKSPDLLDVEKYPKARFRSTAIRPGGEQGASYTVTGNFELHGVTKSITFPVKARVTGDALDASAEFAINRKDFGIVYPGMPDDLIKDDVLLKLKIHGMKMPRTP
ncbi:MAG TPA: YceI family protein [Polyangiaceae bacterium]|nr:YceI family protein [Polyangiaceae bacterium]